MPNVLLTNARLATMQTNGAPYGLVENGAIAISDELIVWYGEADALPTELEGWDNRSLDGRLVTPALIDCHTHIVHGGNRAHEFEMRLEGASYEDIARAGGGIISTVAATRNATEDELLASSLERVDALLAEGVATLEIKSGYGLDVENELKMLRVARRIGEERPVRVRTSFLGAHAVPPENKDDANAYIDTVCIAALEAAHDAGLVDAVDGFCETIAFSRDQIERIFDHARGLGIPVKLHAEQLSNLGGAKLAAEFGGLSADHLEFLDNEGVEAMAAADMVAVLLPGAFYALGETQLPPIAELREKGVPIAVATDCNPGSSPLTSLLLTMNMACTLFGLTPEESLAGTTRCAARALGLADAGIIETGMRADLAIWNISHPSELSYRIGFNPLHEGLFGGLS